MSIIDKENWISPFPDYFLGSQEWGRSFIVSKWFKLRQMVSVMIWFSSLSQWDASIWVTWSVLTNQKPDRPIRGRQCDNRRDNDGQVEGEHLTLNTDHWAIVWGTLCDTKYPGSWRNFSQYSDVGSGSVSGSSSLSVIRIISMHRQLAAPLPFITAFGISFCEYLSKIILFPIVDWRSQGQDFKNWKLVTKELHYNAQSCL